MTSTHSADEDRTRPVHYDRLISTRDGHSESHEHNNVYRECEWVCNTERYANTDALRAAALALRADAQLAPRLTDYSNLLLEEFASRFVRNGVVPGYVPAELAPDLSARLLQMQSAGVLGTAATRIGACMLYGSFERHYGPNRAACLFGHGTQPPHRTSDTRGAH